MTREVIAVSEDEAVRRTAQILVEAEKRQLPVVRDGKPVGTKDRLDLINAFAPNPD